MLSWSTSGIERENANQEFKEFEDVADRTIVSKGEPQLVKCGYRSVAIAGGS
jgi:hypothetical protein